MPRANTHTAGFVMFITMSIELSCSSHACNNLCSTATEGANNKISSAYNTIWALNSLPTSSTYTAKRHDENLAPEPVGLQVLLASTILEHFKYNKNLAIANRSRVSRAHNMSRASIINPWPWNVDKEGRVRLNIFYMIVCIRRPICCRLQSENESDGNEFPREQIFQRYWHVSYMQ